MPAPRFRPSTAPDPNPAGSPELVGGELALDLVNTGSARRGGPFRDRLEGYADLVRWAERVDLVDGAGAKRLRGAARRRSAEADASIERIREVRELIYRIFSPVARREAAGVGDVASLSGLVAEACARREIVEGEDGYTFDFPASSSLDQFLWPVALSASELLVSEDRMRVKECATENCNWLFVDASRNRSRRWCDMKDCGNRAKARRHYARSRRGSGR